MSDTFMITVTGDDQRTLMTVVGYLDIATAEQLRAAVFEQKAAAIALDLAGVDFIDSSGLRALLETQESIAADGRSFSITALSQNAHRLIEMTGLNDTLGIALDDA